MVERRDGVSAADLPGLLRHLHAALSAARHEVDALNVFPVPDGDTGTNLARTVGCAVEAVDQLGDTTDGQHVARTAARGALRGAAGNSGVIFSQVVRAVTDQVALGPLDAAALPTVLRRARDLSYDAVAEPVAGTILTAMDAAVDAAEAACAAGDADLVEVLVEVVLATGQAVAATRDQLPANRDAGVVDAGARGFEVALDAVRGFLAGEPAAAVVPPPVRRTSGSRVSRESGSAAFAYEVQYLLEAPDEVAEEMRRDLTGLGDSVVVVACGGLLNVHVHTNDTDEAVEAGERRGAVSRVQIIAFADEGVEVDPGPGPPEPVGYVTVMPGSGLAALCRSLGATVVRGASGDLPSVADVLDGVGGVRADEIVLLPAHPNVVPTMRQASEVSVAEGGRHLHVLEGVTSVPAALGVLAVARKDRLDLDELAGCAAGVRSAEVVPAVRDADTPVGHVTAGQALVVVEGEVVDAASDPVAAVEEALSRLAAGRAELITLVAGSSVGPNERAAVADLAAEVAPDAEVELVDGQQSPARWIVGVE